MAQAIRDQRVKNRKKLWLQLGIQTNDIPRIYISFRVGHWIQQSKGARKNGFGGGAVRSKGIAKMNPSQTQKVFPIKERK
jgi:hypothetical protein